MKTFGRVAMLLKMVMRSAPAHLRHRGLHRLQIGNAEVSNTSTFGGVANELGIRFSLKEHYLLTNNMDRPEERAATRYRMHIDARARLAFRPLFFLWLVPWQ